MCNSSGATGQRAVASLHPKEHRKRIGHHKNRVGYFREVDTFPYDIRMWPAKVMTLEDI